MTKHIFGFASFNPQNGSLTDTNWELKTLLEFSHTEYDNCVNSCTLLNEYKADAQLFEIVLWNHEDYVELYNCYLESYVKKDLEVFSKRSPELNLNRCLLNLLSSIRSYLDYTELTVKRRYGKSSSMALRFKELCSSAYDNNFSYRFLYRFRNFAQHCGLPLTRIHFNTREDHSYALDVGINRDDLLNQDFEWGPLEAEVSTQPQSININHHVDVMMQCLEGIHSGYLIEQIPRVRSAATVLKSLIDKIPTPVQDELHLFKLPKLSPVNKGERVNFNLQMVPLDVLEYLSKRASG